MMLPPANQPAPRHWAGPTRRDTISAGETIRTPNQRCLTDSACSLHIRSLPGYALRIHKAGREAHTKPYPLNPIAQLFIIRIPARILFSL